MTCPPPFEDRPRAWEVPWVVRGAQLVSGRARSPQDLSHPRPSPGPGCGPWRCRLRRLGPLLHPRSAALSSVPWAGSLSRDTGEGWCQPLGRAAGSPQVPPSSAAFTSTHITALSTLGSWGLLDGAPVCCVWTWEREPGPWAFLGQPRSPAGPGTRVRATFRRHRATCHPVPQPLATGLEASLALSAVAADSGTEDTTGHWHPGVGGEGLCRPLC